MTWRGGGCIAGLALVGVLAGACTGSTSAEPPPSPTPSAAAASPTAEPSPAPSPSPTEVLPANDVDDPVEALEAIVRYRDWLFENPDPDKLKLIYAERCECYEEVGGALREGVEKHWRFDFSRVRRVEDVEIVERDGPFARLKYRFDSPGAEILNATGQVEERIEDAPTLMSEEAFLVKEGGRWLVVALA